MWSFQNNFLTILLISLVYFSYTYSGKNDGIRDCIDNMRSFYGLTTEPIENVRNAIKFMKIYGKNSYKYDKHIEMYYKTFHRHVNTDRIRTPYEFCGDDDVCKSELAMFEIITSDDAYNIMKDNSAGSSGTSSSAAQSGIYDSEYPSETSYSVGPSGISLSYEDMRILNNTQGFEGIMEGTRGYEDRVEESTGSSVYPPEIDVKYRILYNALYYHVIAEPSEIPGDETKVYFHKYKKNGHKYLTDIAKVIVVSGLLYPDEYCQQLYKDQKYHEKPATLVWKT